MRVSQFKNQKAFTLIELLVVIAIIGLLSSVVLASLNTARAKARDAQRLASLKQIQNAIELYASNHDGVYPRTVASDGGRNNSCANGNSSGEPVGDWSSTLGILVTEGLIGSIAKDPVNMDYQSDNPSVNELCYIYTTFPSPTWTLTNGGSSQHWHTMTCGGKAIGLYQYALLFSTETTNFNLPRFGISANYPSSLGYQDDGQGTGGGLPMWTVSKYCILGPLK